MSAEELRTLARRAVDVQGRPLTRLEEVHARIRRARRVRQLGVVAAAVLAVVLVISATSFVVAVVGADQVQPARQPQTGPRSTGPGPTPQEPDDGAAGRQVVWAKGSTVHLGNRAIDVAGQVTGVTATDDGAVYTRGPDTCNATGGCFGDLWFTDGSELVQIGRVSGSVIRGYQVEVSSAGSIVVWREPAPERGSGNSSHPEVGEYVAYDTRQRREVARMRSDHKPYRTGWPGIEIQAVFDDYVYWTPDVQGQEWCADYVRAGAVCRRFRAVMRLDTATGAQSKVPWSAYLSDRSNRPRLFFGPTDRPDVPYNAFPYNRPGAETIAFGRQGDRLVPHDLGGGAVTARVGLHGEVVRLRLPSGYHPQDVAFTVVQWLDDDRVVVSPQAPADLLVCRLPAGRCRLAVTGIGVVLFGGRG